MKAFGIYIVMSSPYLGYQRFTEICVEQDLPMLQLREKNMNDMELLRLASELASITRGSSTTFMINDRVDLCLLSGADGVHLGPDDLSWQEARKLLSPSQIIGVSTHSIAQARGIIAEAKNSDYGPDYMSFGPIYPTVAKAIPDQPVGVDQLSRVIGEAHLPVVAIGGIFPSKLGAVLSSGAKNISMIRHFGESQTPEELITKIKQIKLMLTEVRK